MKLDYNERGSTGMFSPNFQNSSVSTSNNFMYNSVSNPTSTTRFIREGLIGMAEMDLHIQSINNGFILTYIEDNIAKTLAFNELETMLQYIKDLGLMSIDQTEVVENV